MNITEEKIAKIESFLTKFLCFLKLTEIPKALAWKQNKIMIEKKLNEFKFTFWSNSFTALRNFTIDFCLESWQKNATNTKKDPETTLTNQIFEINKTLPESEK